jgi:hypothetical protein
MPVTVEELRGLISSRPTDEVVDVHVFGGDAYVFRETPADYQLLLTDLGTSLRLNPAAITIVGSAKLGFSMDPEAFGTPFREESDVDVVVVDPDRFDRIWYALIAWEYGLAPQKGYKQQWLKRRHEDVFWGWFFGESLHSGGFHGEALRAVRDISYEWFEAFQSVGLRHSRLAGRKFKGRLYRTWDHARSYHTQGLLKYRESLEASP